jgi:hypothetical protein
MIDSLLTLSTIFNIVWGVSTSMFVLWRFSSTFYSVFVFFSYTSSFVRFLARKFTHSHEGVHVALEHMESPPSRERKWVSLYNKVYTMLWRVRPPHEYSIQQTQAIPFMDGVDYQPGTCIEEEDVADLECENEQFVAQCYEQCDYLMENAPTPEPSVPFSVVIQC